MTSTIPISFAIFSTLVQAIFFYCSTSAHPTRYTNTTHHLLSSNSGRLKRSLMGEVPPFLKVNIKYNSGEKDHLRLTIVDSKLANEYLPILTPFGYSSENVMKNIGDFVMYHDLLKRSAVVYFAKYNAMYGVIGVNYIIEALPFVFDDDGHYQLGVVGSPYISTHGGSLFHIPPRSLFPPPSDSEAWYDFFQTPPTVANQPGHADPGPSHRSDGNFNNERTDSIDKEEDADNEREITTKNNSGISDYKKHFLEILVLVTSDIVDQFKLLLGEDDFIEWIVIYHIVYFNAVDMMFNKIRNKYGQMQINIAKIVIDDILEPFHFMSNGENQFNTIITGVPQYLQNHQSFFLPDSFDHVFIHTSRTIMDDVISVRGISKFGHDLYEARKHNIYYDVVPVTIVKSENSYIDYVVALHEIARTLTLKLETKDKGLIRDKQCYSLMQREGPKCENCLRWSGESRKYFREFLKSNRNRCFLLNEPHALKQPGVSKFMTANRQCQCFGYLSHDVDLSGYGKPFVGVENCAKPIQCTRLIGDHMILESTVRPFDGTPATSMKVCWNGQAVMLPKQPRDDSCTQISSN